MSNPNMRKSSCLLLLILLSGAWAQQNTPGGVRSVDESQSESTEPGYGGEFWPLQQQAQAQAQPGPAAAAQVPEDSVSSSSLRQDESDVGSLDTGQMFFQSIPNFPETEGEALATYTGILRSPSTPEGSSTSGRTAADDFIDALLKTTRASLANTNTSIRSAGQGAAGDAGVPQPTPQGNNAGSTTGSAAAVQDSTSSADTADTVDDDDDDDHHDDSSSDAAKRHQRDQDFRKPSSTLQGSMQAAAAAGEPSQGDTRNSKQPKSPITAAAAAADAAAPAADAAAAANAAASSVAAGASQPLAADAASAVEGQVLVTQAEIIPSMKHFSKVVLTSFKMRPMPVQELLAQAAAGPGKGSAAAKAAAWQDNLKEALEAAAALETNTSVTQMHTRMTSIINLVSTEAHNVQSALCSSTMSSRDCSRVCALLTQICGLCAACSITAWKTSHSLIVCPAALCSAVPCRVATSAGPGACRATACPCISSCQRPGQQHQAPHRG
jgi:hypothetical protein